MVDITFGQFFSKKAFELSYALFRLASVMRHPSFASHLEDRALSLLGNTAKGEYKEALGILDAIEYLLRLGIEIGFVALKSGNTIIEEASYLKSAIAEFSNAAKLPDSDLSNIFSHESPFDDSNREESIAKQSTKSTQHVGNEGSSDETLSLQIQRAVMRQSAILDKIRQAGGCRLKDLQEILPDISDRTIRYDIQKLLDQGLIERLGGGGPSTSYQAL